MINVEEVIDRKICGYEIPESLSMEKLIRSVENVVRTIEKEGLTYTQARDVLNMTKKVLKRQKLRIDVID